MARRPPSTDPDLADLARIARASRQRMGRPIAAPTRVRELLEGAQRGTSRRAGVGVDLETWRLAVGDRIADRATPGSLKNKVLTIRVSSAVWAQELSLLSNQLIAQLRECRVDVVSLRFATSGARRPLPPPRAKQVEAKLPPLPDDLRHRIGQIDDPDLRAIVAEAAARSLAVHATPSEPPPNAPNPQSAGSKNAPWDPKRRKPT